MTDSIVRYEVSGILQMDGKAQTLVIAARSFKIESPEDSKKAAEALAEVKDCQKRLEAMRAQALEPINRAREVIMMHVKPPEKYLVEAEGFLKAAIAGWIARQREEQARALAEASQRTTSEGNQLEEELKSAKADEAAALKRAHGAADEDAKRQELKLVTEARGRASLAELSLGVLDAAPAAEISTRVENVSLRKNYAAEVKDFAALIKAVADGRAPQECLQPDAKFLGTQARAFKKADGAELYPGVVSRVSESVVAGRG